MSEDLSVLMIDDNPADGDTVRRYLAEDEVSWDVEFKQVLSADEAVSELRNRQYEVLFVDYHFPFGNGFDILRKIREDGVDSPAVMLTGQGDEEVASQAVAENLTAYLPKSNLAPQALEETLRTALKHDRREGKGGDSGRSRVPTSGGESDFPGPAGLLKRISENLNETVPGGLLFVVFNGETQNVGVDSETVRILRNEFHRDLAFHRIRENVVASWVEPTVLEDLMSQSDEALTSGIRDALPGDGKLGLRLLVTELDTFAVDPVVPLNDGLDQIVTQRRNDSPDRVRILKGAR